MEQREQEALIVSLCDELLAGGQAGVARLFREWGAGLPEILIDPAEAALPLERLRFLLRYWQGLARAPGHDLPAAAAVDALDLKPALGYVMLLDVLDGGRDYRYRVYPGEVARAAGRDYTGLRTSEIGFGPTSLFYLAVYRAGIALRRPIYTRHTSPPHLSVYHWDRLGLPLAGEDGAVSRFLVGNVPGPFRPPSF